MSVIVDLLGGLGNQCFQFALGRALEARGEQVKFNVLEYQHQPNPRMYMLDQLGLDLLLVNTNDGSPVHEGTMRFQSHILDSKNVRLRGYWQTERYFLPVEAKIRSEIFSGNFYLGDASKRMADEIASKPNSAFLHVRRSDNLSKRALRFHGMLDGKYYQDGLTYIRERVENAHFFVFSDGPDWTRENMKDSDMTVVDCNPFSGTVDEAGTITHKPGGREVEDLKLMSLCKHAIIANSSFSWWGAWLGGKDPSRIVTFPKAWFLPDPTRGDLPDATDIPLSRGCACDSRCRRPQSHSRRSPCPSHEVRYRCGM